MLMYLRPWAVGGTMPYSSSGYRPSTPMMTWVLGLVKSRSRRPTPRPCSARLRARAVATMLLPTPPLPLLTATTRPTSPSLVPMTASLGSLMALDPFDGGEPDAAALRDLEVGASALAALDVHVGHLGDEVDGLGDVLGHALGLEAPLVAAVPAPEPGRLGP